MKKIRLYIFTLLIASAYVIHGQERQMDSFIDSLMNQMSVDEKIGQLNLAASWGFRSALSGNTQDESLQQVRNGQMGAFYGFKNVDEMTRLQKMAVEEGKHGIPFFFGMDVIHGLETTFPIPLALSASWDTALIEQSARMSAREAKALGINWVFSPMVDISRDARWGRVSEGSGEDPYLGGEIARAYVTGYESEGLMTCVKHFALYGAGESGRDYNTVSMSRPEMMNGFMRPYHEAVKAGASSFMASFNDFEEIPATCNSFLLYDILRKRWGFNGFVVTDASGIANLVDHGMGDLAQSSVLALKAGIDMDMNSNGFVGTLKQSLADGTMSMTDIDRACRRILEAKYRLGLFDNPYKYLDPAEKETYVYTPEMKEFAYQAALKCPVLLKNEGNILPLRKNAKIALVGPLADNAENMQGAWAVSSHGKESVSILQGIRSALKGGNVKYAEGSWLVSDSTLESTLKTDLIGFYLYGIKPEPVHQRPLEEMIAEAVAATSEADVIVACLGETNAMNGEGASRSDITIPAPQKQLLKALSATGKPVVLVLTTGRPIVLTEEAEYVPAILCTWALGDQAGRAIADILFGDVSPSGKLTMTFPRSVGQCPIYYNHKNTGRPHPDFAPYKKFTSCYMDVVNAPLYPFGYGLSYTTFDYSPIALDGRTATVTVTNTGTRDAEEVVQLYIHDKVASSTRPVKELKGFKRISLKAGESKTVSFDITDEMLSFYNHNLEFMLESGDFDIMIGPDSSRLHSTTLIVK